MPDKELKLHEGTKEALAGVLFCPICGSNEITVDDIHLFKAFTFSCMGKSYRKRRDISCTCKKCLEDERGAVQFHVLQCF